MQTNLSIYNPYTTYNYPPNFCAKGKPLDLKYIVEKRGYLLPARVRNYAQKLIAAGNDTGVSLLEIHKSLYAQLLECRSLDEAKKLYPEFKDILPTVPILHKSVNSSGRVSENFGLRVLQEYWGKLKSKDEIASDLGMNNRAALDFSLKKINFSGFEHNYKTMLKASDETGNREIMEKTQAWNKANPEIRRQLNIHAAQGCKTEEYRTAQAQRMYEYDRLHPERKKKISDYSYRMWQNCPEVRTAISEFGRTQGGCWAHLMTKSARKEKLTESEQRMIAIFFKRFWISHPELKANLAKAAEAARRGE